MDFNEDEIVLNEDTLEKEDLDSLRELIIMGGNPDDLIVPYLEGLNIQKNRLEKLKQYIQTQKPDKKNKYLLGLIEKLS